MDDTYYPMVFSVNMPGFIYADGAASLANIKEQWRRQFGKEFELLHFDGEEPPQRPVEKYPYDEGSEYRHA
jgi:hypothetical protein